MAFGLMRRIAARLLLCVAAGGAAAVHAQPLTDPTRPPADLLSQAVPAGAATPAGPALTAIVLASDRKYAVIDGRVVPLGGQHGSARLVELSPVEAVLSEGKERIVMRLLPAVEPAGAANKVSNGKVMSGKTSK